MMIAGIIKFLFVLTVMVIVHELGHFIAARKTGVRVETFSIGFGKKLFRRKGKETEFAVSAIPLGGYVTMAGDTLDNYQGKPDEFFAKPASKRFAIVVCGPVMNYLLGILLFWMIFFFGYPVLTTKVGGLVEGKGAQRAGILAGDTITAVENVRVQYWDDMVGAIRSRQDQDSLKITLVRAGQEMTYEVQLVQETLPDALKQKRKVGLIGIRPDFETTVVMKHGFWQSLPLGIGKTWELTTLTYKAFWYIITRKIDARESVTGPVGIWELISRTKTLNEILVLMAVLSISLAIFNLLPVPPLDGGHILFMIIEKLRGKPLDKKTDEIVGRIGWGLFVLLGVAVFVNDLIRLGVVQKAAVLIQKIVGRFIH
jgi:regulator of sigma E protease